MITLRAEPFFTGGPRPRLSLYLSSQLMYGCVKVYNKQNDYLISESVLCLHNFYCFKCSGGSKGGRPLRPKIFSISCSFLEIFGNIIG